MIHKLIPNIYALLKQKGWCDEAMSAKLSADITSKLSEQLGAHSHTPSLRLSQLGPRCPKALWHSIKTPELAEALPPWAEIKFALGHVVEGMAITLARAAGHKVEGEQDELVFDGIVGHRDCVIDGSIVDVKSASSISFSKFKAGTFEDTFGYLDQLDGYVLASADDPLVTVKDKGYLLLVDKQLGHMYLHEHTTTPERAELLRRRIEEYKRIVNSSVPPECSCGTVNTNYYGNIMLDTRASYSPFKWVCHPSLRCFLYAKGPIYLTTVNKQPWNKNGPIREIDKHGNTVYN